MAEGASPGANKAKDKGREQASGGQLAAGTRVVVLEAEGEARLGEQGVIVEAGTDTEGGSTGGYLVRMEASGAEIRLEAQQVGERLVLAALKAEDWPQLAAEVRREGWLHKKGALNPLYKRRWFALRGSSQPFLAWYDYSTMSYREVPKGFIALGAARPHAPSAAPVAPRRSRAPPRPPRLR